MSIVKQVRRLTEVWTDSCWCYWTKLHEISADLQDDSEGISKKAQPVISTSLSSETQQNSQKSTLDPILSADLAEGSKIKAGFQSVVA
jgi:hypothetical protein